MPAFTASRKIDRVRINESLCEMVTNLVTSWCPDSARLRLTIAGQDDSGLSKSADLACLPDAISYISSLGLVSQLRVVCQAEERNATVRLYDDHQKVNDNSIEVESNADEENERFIAAFTASIKEQVVQQAQTNADAQPVSQVGRTILLRYIRLDANTIISLAELCGQLLGSDDLPNLGTFSIVGRDVSKREVTLEPKSFSGVRSLVTKLVYFKEVALSVYGSRRISLRLSTSKILPSKVEILSDANWTDGATLRFREWGKAYRLRGLRYGWAKFCRVLWDYLHLAVGILPVVVWVALNMGQGNKMEPHRTSQLTELQQTRESLQRSLDFVDKLESDVRSQQAALEAIKKEHKEWDPVIQTDRKAIEQIGVILSQNARRERWVDIGVSFLIGVGSSLAASWLYLGKRKRKEASDRERSVP